MVCMMYKEDLLNVCGCFALFGAGIVLGKHMIDSFLLGLTVVFCHVYTQI